MSTVINQPVRISREEFYVRLAIGVLTLGVTILVLWLLNYCIYCGYHPDVTAIVEKVSSESLMSRETFRPEPVERMQFQLSVLCAPIVIFIGYHFFFRLQGLFTRYPKVPLCINILGLCSSAAYILFVFQKSLVHIDDQMWFLFANNLIHKFSFVAGFTFYAVVTAGFLMAARYLRSLFWRRLWQIVSIALLVVILGQLILYNVLQLGRQDYLRTMETNAVFYSITQVYAGKSLLVNLNCQYGLFAWFLAPLFKLIGLSTVKFSLVMGGLNTLSFLFIFLGIRKLIKQDLLALIVFLALIFWQYWQTKLPLDTIPRYYYQYWPVRFLFPSAAFFLLVTYFRAEEKRKRRLAIPLAIVSSFAVLWNFDSGFIVFGAVLLSLIYAVFLETPWNKSLKKAFGVSLLMAGALIAALAVFMLSAKISAGAWPDFKHFLDYQGFFYLSGFFMLPMSAIHFWNLPVLVYLVCGIYCVHRLKAKYEWDAPVLAFLFVLGLGLFSYFQGRSYDANVTLVMYPAIIIAGVFCDKLLAIIMDGKWRLGLTALIFFVPFLFLADGAFSMLGTMPSIQSVAWQNVQTDTTRRGKDLKARAAFITKSFTPRDTVIIIAKDFESYYYTAGGYYNPLNLSSSTEVFFKSELYSLLDVIEERRYPIVYDAIVPWENNDTIVKTLRANTFIEKELVPDRSFFLFKPLPKKAAALVDGPDVIYHYRRFDSLDNRNSLFPKLRLPDTFTMELSISPLDTALLSGACWIFNNATPDKPFSGIKMEQKTNDLAQFAFSYGNGKMWCDGVLCKLSCKLDNHISINVKKNIVSICNNGTLFATINTSSAIDNTDGTVHFNPDFPGTIREIIISRK